MTNEMTSTADVYQKPTIVFLGMAQDLILGSACGMLDADNQTRSVSMGCGGNVGLLDA